MIKEIYNLNSSSRKEMKMTLRKFIQLVKRYGFDRAIDSFCLSSEEIDHLLQVPMLNISKRAKMPPGISSAELN